MANISLSIFLTSILLLPFLTISFTPENPTNKQILVLLDDSSIKSSHSVFFNSLQQRGYSLDFKLADDPKISLNRYGQYLYEALILFSPSVTKFGGSLDAASILAFVDAGHDLILAADSNPSDLIREIAVECGVDFDEDASAVVIDHANYAEKDGDHSLIVSDDFILSHAILGRDMIQAPVLFKGIAHTLNPANSQILKVLSASESAYSANPDTKLSSPPSLTGSKISLVSVVQARNNARILISGSLDLFSNRLFSSGVKKAGSLTKYSKSGNEQFATEISKWVFHERGHLKAVNVRHNKVGEAGEPAMYRITDDLEYFVEIYEWSGTNWEPYVADDVQIQFYMMSPYVLKALSTDKKGLFHTSFKVPDVYGVFQFKVEYHRLGYTSLSLAKQIPVRPFRHNEYERFLTAAFPYYGSSFSAMAGFFVFTVVYLYNK